MTRRPTLAAAMLGAMVCLSPWEMAVAETDADNEAVLSIGQSLVEETARLCRALDVPSLRAELTGFSTKLKALGLNADHFDGAASKGALVDFSAWGLDEDILPADKKDLGRVSMFVDVRIQAVAGRTVLNCRVTDSTTPPKLAEARWLGIVGAMEPRAGATETASSEDGVWARHVFDRSKANVTEQVSVTRYEVKTEFDIVRVTGQ